MGLALFASRASVSTVTPMRSGTSFSGIPSARQIGA
jgi:hypothetical protein